MKIGRYFRIPERPSELWELWKQAQPLRPDRLPAWLTWEDAAAYRYVGCTSASGLSDENNAGLKAEIEEAELARLIVDDDPHQADLRHVYIEAPRDDAVWSIGIYQGPSPLGLSPAGIKQPVLTAENVSDVAAAFVADPFLLRRGNCWYMFFEVMNWKANKGEIALATSSDGLNWRYEQIVLAEEFHLSYPHVFMADGETYMIPESFQDDSIRLYRATRFPQEWQCIDKLLIGGYFADSTPFQHDGTWWMFTETNPTGNDTLRLFFADKVTGPWCEHPQSPIIAGDSENSRPAGRVLAGPQGLVRFAQNCSIEYGVDVRAIGISRLTRTEYQEKAAFKVLGPTGKGWNALGMHHLDALQCENGQWLAAVDGWTRFAR